MIRQTILVSATLITGIFLGWLFFHDTPTKEEKHDHWADIIKSTIWTCAMHPQIKMTEPGKCPICGMELIPLIQGGAAMDGDAIHMTREAIQLANVLTSVVSKQNPVKELRLYGKVQADERLLQSQVSYLPGRIEKLLVNFTGEFVRKGQPLAMIYSPELVTAQQELLETSASKQTQPELYEAAKEKLHQWKLTDSQISSVENSGKVKTEFEIFANATGIVSARRVNDGDFVTPGSVLFEVADLSHVWVMFDAYESDLPYLANGQIVSFTVQALPGKDYSGKITFIDPVLNPVTRVARVRIEIGNQRGKLKPEMFAAGIVKANMNQFNDKLTIPRSAVLWTGKRSVVYVKQPGVEPVFRIRVIELGPQLGNSYLVINGLTNGEEIVTQGAFSVDASAQLEGKPSMMNPSAVKISPMPGKFISVEGKGTGKNEMSTLVTNDVSIMKSNATPPVQAKSSILQHSIIGVSGNCDLCKERIESAAKSLSGVTTAEWSTETKKLDLQYDASKINSDDIQKAIAKAGHDTEKFKAYDGDYKKLPGCCLYRK